MKKVIAKRLPVLDVIDGIRVVGICEWMTLAYGEDIWDRREEYPTYEEVGRDLMAWCAENNSAYWAAPREDFSIHVAARFAKERGNSIVVVEDMS